MNEFLVDAFKKAPSGDSLSKKIYDILFEAILEQRLQPGDILIETQIADILNISRTPCREAINKLEMEGLVERIPNKGTVITTVSKEDLKEITSMLSVLQGLAARFATENATKDFLEKLKMNIEEIKFHTRNKDFPIKYIAEKNKIFHNLILEMTGQKRLTSTINNLHDQIKRARGTSMSIPDRRKKAIQQHEALYEEIKSGNVDKAEEVMKTHILEWGQVLIKLENNQEEKAKAIK